MKEKTDEEYKQEWEALAKKYVISVRVVRHVKNSYDDKYSDLSYKEAIGRIIHDAKGKLARAKQSYRAVVIEYTRYALKEPDGLAQSKRITDKLESERENLYGYLDKIGFRKSIIRFLKRLTEDQLKDIIETEF